MSGIGEAILLMALLPFAVLGVASALLFRPFKRTKSIAFPALFFFFGYGFGNLIAHEYWAEPILRATWIKMYLEAPIHSLLYATLFAVVAFLLFGGRSRNSMDSA